MALENLVAFLRSHRSTGEYNFVSLKGGKYHIKSEHSEKFIDLYCQAIPYFTEQNATSLAWRKPDIDYLPLIFDIDLQVKENIKLTNEVFIELAKMFMFYVSTEIMEGMGVVLTRKQQCYPKQTKQGIVFKTGFHMFIFGVLVTKEVALKIRNIIIPELETYVEERKYIVNTAEDILDKLVCPFGKNGMLMLQDYKPSHNTGKNYSIFFRGTYIPAKDDWNNPTEFEPHQTVKLLCDMRNLFWGWLWQVPEWKKFGELKKNDAIGDIKVMKYNPNIFNLKLFLELTADHIPNNSEYLQIVMYCASVQIPVDQVTQLCNTAWKPKDKSETERVYKSFKKRGVNRGSLVRYLTIHSKEPFILEDIWKERVTRMYNDYKDFTDVDKIYYLGEIETFLTDTIVYVFSIKKFSWQYVLTKRDKHGNAIQEIQRCISKEAPFMGSDNFAVTIYPTKPELLKVLENAIPKKINASDKKMLQKITAINKLIEEFQILTNKVALERTKSILEKIPEPKVIDIARIIKRLQMSCKLKRYTNLTFRPYTDQIDPTPELTLNTFSGFLLDRYIPQKHIDVKTTQIWVYFYDVFGWADPKMKMMDYILDFVAFMIQFPAQRSERLIGIISKKQGTGKSFFFRILQMIFQGYCSFHDSLDTLLQRFNIENNSMKVHWCDDIFGATQQQTRKLFPRTTCKTQKYEAKGERMITLPEYAEFFITSNQQSPLHLSPEDRRQLLIEVSDLHLQERDFYKKVDAETENLDIAYAWFQFFKHRDITKFHPSHDPPSHTKAKSIESCMVKAHSFLTKFFSDGEDWPRMYKTPEALFSTWANLYEIKLISKGQFKNQVRLRIETKRFYNLYKRYTQQFYSSSKPRNQDTFFKEIEDGGVIVYKKRKYINSKKKSCVDIYYSRCYTFLIKLYPELKFEWDHQTDATQVIQQLKQLQTF